MSKKSLVFRRVGEVSGILVEVRFGFFSFRFGVYGFGGVLEVFFWFAGFSLFCFHYI